MKYSTMGHVDVAGASDVIALLNTYSLWKLDPRTDHESGVFFFEAWVNDQADGLSMFNALKPLADLHNGYLMRHECTHEEAEPQPCIAQEEYSGAGG